MRAVVQRVKNSSVVVGEKTIGEIGPGLMVLLGVAEADTEKDADFLAEKIPHLRIFEDKDGKMDLSLIEVKGQMLVVSQFTLLGSCRKGRRPSFIGAAAPQQANALYEYFIKKVREKGVPVETGRFRAKMEVFILNHGPVTLVIDS